MKLFCNTSVYVCLCLTIGFSQLSYAIYDPSLSTIKPPKHRESVVPWYLSGKDVQPPSDLSRSSKWNRSEEVKPARRPVIVNAGTKTWSAWHKPANSEIEQRSEVVNYEQSENQGFEQSHHGVEQYGDMEQTETFEQSQLGWEEQYQHSQDQMENVEDGDPYVQIAVANKKPHRERIRVAAKPSQSIRVAKFDTASGVQCPDSEATGQFVYPPDCKFFVNCWKGRAFVQPCAPGTLFNPESLECDYPHKVKCYGGQFADYTSSGDLEAAGRRESFHSQSQTAYETAKPKEPKCPPQVTGLLPHPTDCTKFLQCANGGTFVMDCGPGTVFNPAVSVCDWPYNVKGCGGGGEDTAVPADTGVEVIVKKTECPSGHTGLLPHPTDCTKFWQCSNGITHITDCGPGTVFNPITTICDWPYNVEGCGKDGSVSNTNVQPGGQWTENNHGHVIGGQSSGQSSHGTQGQNSWQGNVHGQGGQQESSGHDSWVHGSHGQQGQSGQSHNGQTGHQTGRWGHNGQPGQNIPSSQQGQYDASYGYYDQNGEYHGNRENQQHGQWQNGHSGTSWSHHHTHSGTGDESSQNGGQQWGHHHRQEQDQTTNVEGGQISGQWGHHHRQEQNQTMTNMEGGQTSGQWGHHHRQEQDQTTTHVEDGTISGQQWGHGHSHHHHHDDQESGQLDHSHSHHHHDGNVDRGGQDIHTNNGQPTGQWQHSHPHRHDHHTHGHNGDETEEGYQGQNANGRGSYDRQGYGRTDGSFTTQTGSSQPESNQNVYVDRNYKLSGEFDSSSRTDQNTASSSGHTQTRPSENRDQSGQNPRPSGWNYGQVWSTGQSGNNQQTWNQQESHTARPGIFRPSTWRGSQGEETSTSGQGARVWHQGGYEITNRTQHQDMLGLNENSNGHPGNYPNALANENRTIFNGRKENQFSSSEVEAQMIDEDRNNNSTSSMLNNTTSSNKNMSANGIFHFASESENSYSEGNVNKSTHLGTDQGTTFSDIHPSSNRKIISSEGFGKEYWVATEGGTIFAAANGNGGIGNPERGNITFNSETTSQETNARDSIISDTNVASANVASAKKTDRVHNRTRGEDSKFDLEENNTISGTGTNVQDSKIDQWSTNISGQERRDERLDSKLNQWAAKTNIFGQTKKPTGTISKWVKWGDDDIYFPPDDFVEMKNTNKEQSSTYDNLNSTGIKTTSENDRKNPSLYPNGIYVNENGMKGHYITKEIEINQGHSNTRQYGNEDINTPHTFSSKNYSDSYGQKPSIHEQAVMQGASPEKPTSDVKNESANANSYDLAAVESTFLQNEIYRTTTDPNIPIVSIDYEGVETGNRDKNAAENTTRDSDLDPVEPEMEIFDVDLLHEKERWKPKLVYENKTKETKKSVILEINKDKIDVDIFDVEIIQEEEEPPFPVYYIPPVEPLSAPFKLPLLTPISGQILRLRGGSSPREGYLEVQGAQPGWGLVCDSRNGWTHIEADVVCRQLGYSRGAEMAWQGRSARTDAPTWIAADSVYCNGNETKFQSCKFTHGPECSNARDAVGIRCLPNRVAHCRRDEVAHQGHCYHLADPDSGLNHAEALNYCGSRKAQLLDVTTQGENNFVSEWLVQSYPEVESVMTSGVGFTTLNRTIWLWEDSNRARFRFNKWWPGWMEDKQPPSVGSRPVCIVMKRNFPCHNRPDDNCGTDYFFWDFEDCAASMKGHSYICKRPFDDIGCVYGKGQQYSGTANVTATGKDCLPWDHDDVRGYLAAKVVSVETTAKLQGHSYCRNPNSDKETRPWCFTGPYGEFEYCEIPPCFKLGGKKSIAAGRCKPKHFECTPGECIPSPWICDGEEDCTNGADEKACSQHLNLFVKKEKHRLEGYDVEKWLNTPVKTCALRCKDADFTCRSFSHKADDNVCLLSDSNVGLTGSLEAADEFTYYEMTERSINCEGMYVCGNKKCINQTQVCNGKNDCGDRSDENICTVDDLGYEIRLAGSNSTHEGRIEVKALGQWGQVCDDGFGMIAAGIVCKELGFALGAIEVRAGFYGNLEPPSLFLVDQLKCRGNETSLRECDFDGWGVHNCRPEEAVGVVCKRAVDNCQDGYWKCDNSPECIPSAFICDEVEDCADLSDEGPEHCDAPFELRLAEGKTPMEGRVEVRHHGVWGTVCDDDFSKMAASVICRSLGYGGPATAKKNGAFGPGEGPIWLDEVFCHGNETQLYRCDHSPWGKHNCVHDEDVGVVCSPGAVSPEQSEELIPDVPEIPTNDLLPTECGQRAEDFNSEDEYVARVVSGSVAPKGAYPWQASIRVRGHSKSNHWCGAVVISPLHVLTAAHCLEGYNKGMYFVRAGDHNTDINEGTEIEANIEDYFIHEDFRKGQRMNNDIALVLLKGRGIPLGKNIMAICLPPPNTEYMPGLNCTISGWGSTDSGQSVPSRDLRYGWVPLLDQSVCQADYVYGEGSISDGMVCAGHLDEGVDTCDGDSGGPLACYHNGAFTLYGVTSWGQHCGRVNKPGVYVRIAHYRSWIDRQLRESLAGR